MNSTVRMTASTASLADLKARAKSVRKNIITSTTAAGSGHPTSSLSAVEIAVALYFGGILRYDPKNPHWPERDRFILSKGHAGRAVHGRESILAPMPGKIVRLLVAPGDSVEAGQGIIVIEAMKMQNELKARRSGRVVALPVREGETVAAGAVLATFE